MIYVGISDGLWQPTRKQDITARQNDLLYLPSRAQSATYVYTNNQIAKKWTRDDLKKTGPSAA
jgi:hypothetical protein